MIFVASFILVTIRLVAMIVVAPVLGHRSVPLYAKLLIAIMVSMSITPMVVESGAANFKDLNQLTTDLISILANEAVIGSMLGLGVLIIFSSAMLIGSAIGQLSGLQLDSLSPNQEFGQQPATRLIGITAAVLFILGGGLEMMFASVIESFLEVPLGSSISSSAAIETLISLLQQSFELTIRAIAPAIATLLISTVVIGGVSRIMPQLNLIQVGLSSNYALMMLTLFLTIGGYLWLVIDGTEDAARTIIQSIMLQQ